MLIEIQSTKLRVGSVKFHRGLNVVLGDHNATNSIGKSTLLMLVDFGFGGDGFVELNGDAVDQLGHHDYYFTFQFDDEAHTFRRGTASPDVVFTCDHNFESVDSLSIEEYRAFLKAAYWGDLDDSSFRGVVGLYSRIWGKDNLNVHKPLHSVQGQSASECINQLIKTFGRYGDIAAYSKALRDLEKTSSLYRRAFTRGVLPRVTKRRYRANSRAIEGVEAEIADIKEHLAQFALSVSEVVNKDVLELKSQKDRLLAAKLQIDDKLRRVRESAQGVRRVSRRSFESLLKYFPTVDVERLEQVEEFHKDISRILRSEIEESERELAAHSRSVEREIQQLSERIGSALGAPRGPEQIIDRVVDLSKTLASARRENEFFDTSKRIDEERRTVAEALEGRKVLVLSSIEKELNERMTEIVSSVYGPERKSPAIHLGQSSYSFDVYEDTGTGTAYSSLVIFDQAVFTTTKLPFVIHDSVLFKNIENRAVSNLLSIYSETEKQSFVSLDEIEKYGPRTAQYLRDKSVISLSNKAVLYVKDWRAR